MTREIERIYAQLEIRETDCRVIFSSEPDPSAPYQFELHRKQATLGQVVIDQF